MNGRSRVLLLFVGAATLGFVSEGGSAQGAATNVPLSTSCASGVVVDYPPGFEPESDSIGPVVVDSSVSPKLYGEQVNVLDGISPSEVSSVRDVGTHLKFCKMLDDPEGAQWQVIYVP